MKSLHRRLSASFLFLLRSLGILLLDRTENKLQYSRGSMVHLRPSMELALDFDTCYFPAVSLRMRDSIHWRATKYTSEYRHGTTLFPREFYRRDTIPERQYSLWHQDRTVPLVQRYFQKLSTTNSATKSRWYVRQSILKYNYRMAQTTKWLPAILDYTKNVTLSISTSHPTYTPPQEGTNSIVIPIFVLFIFYSLHRDEI